MSELRLRSAPGRWVVAATVLGSGMAAIDATVVGIALPTIGRTFHSAMASLQWVVSGYALALAALLLLGGSLGDRYGRRRIFSIGVVWFTLGSAACALSSGPTMLIVTRVLQGVGAALLTPGSLALIQASFHPDDRGRAIGAWSGLGGVATAAGPLLGGYIVTAASWRWIFLINLPIGAAVLVVSARHVPESRDPAARGSVDVAGALLAVLALGGVTFGLIEEPSLGWSNASVVAMLVLGAVALALFVVVERAVASPMLPPGLFASRQFSVVNALTFVVYAALGGLLFLLPVELQIVDRYSPVGSGMALLPLTFVMLGLSSRSGRLAARVGPRAQLSVGPFVVGAGIALLSRTATDSSYLTGVLPAVLVFGVGLVTTVAPLTATALGAAPAEHSGIASAVNNCVARTGGLLAVAILPALAGITGRSYLHPASFSGDFRSAVFLAAALCGVGGLVAAAGIRNPPREIAPQDRVREPAPQESSTHGALDATPFVDQA